MKDPYGYRPYRGSRVRRRGIIINTLLAVAILAAAVWVLCLLLPLDEGGLRFPGQRDTAADGTAADAPADDAGPSPDSGKAEPPAEASLEGASGKAQPSEETDKGAQLPLSAMKDPEKVQPLFPARPEAPQNNRMALLSAEDFTGQADQLLQLYQSKAVTGAAVVMKDKRGVLYYPSKEGHVQDEPGILKPVDGIVQAVERLRAAGMPLTAVMYTHEDDLYPRMNENRALQNVEHVGWRDAGGRVFLDPANAEATEYLTAVAKELQDLGFQEILLRGLGYPAEGWLQRIAYADDRFGTVTGLVTAVQTAAPSAQVSVWLDSPEIPMNVDTGQSVQALYNTASRVFAELSGAEAGGAASLQAAVNAAAGGSGKLVTVVSGTDGAEALPAVLFDIPLDDLQIEP